MNFGLVIDTQEVPVRAVEHIPLFLGSEACAMDHSMLRDLGIKRIIVLSAGVHDCDAGLLEESYGITRDVVGMKDSSDEDLRGRFDSVFALIDSSVAQGHGVLVHCRAGISRSPSIVIAWCMSRLRMSLRAAWNTIRQAREVMPNPAFAAALVRFERELFGRCTMIVAHGELLPYSQPASGSSVLDDQIIDCLQLDRSFDEKHIIDRERKNSVDLGKWLPVPRSATTPT